MIDSISGGFLQWLRGFYHTAKLGSVSAAAEHMGLRQPAVTHQLHALEAELGVQLFHRSSKSMILTAEGCRLYERSMHIFELLKEVKTDIGASEDGSYKGEIAIATTYAIAQYYLPRHLLGFASLHPDVRFSIFSSAAADTITTQVLSAEIDMGITIGQSFPASVITTPLFTSQLVLIVQKDAAVRNGWRFSRDSNGNLADMAELDGVPFVSFLPQAQMTQIIERHLARYSVRPKTVATVNTSTLLKRYVEIGFGVSILDEFSIEAERHLFEVYPLDLDDAVRTYYLLIRRNKYLTKHTEEFIKFLHA